MRFFVWALGFLISLQSMATGFDHKHELWNKLVKEYAVKKGRQALLNYKQLKKNQKTLDRYLEHLESTSQKDFSSFSSDQKLAFWINAYNAYTIKIVLDHYPVQSIQDINSGWFSSGPWKKEFISLLGKKMSLDDIEHEIIRKEFDEPRIHFAVNCASLSCPSLLQEAFIAEKLDEQLDIAAQNFLQNQSKNYLRGNTLYVSKIFKWYGDDFKSKYGGFKNYIIQSLSLPAKDYEIKFNDYDWSLNEIK